MSRNYEKPASRSTFRRKSVAPRFDLRLCKYCKTSNEPTAEYCRNCHKKVLGQKEPSIILWLRGQWMAITALCVSIAGFYWSHLRTLERVVLHADTFKVVCEREMRGMRSLQCIMNVNLHISNPGDVPVAVNLFESAAIFETPPAARASLPTLGVSHLPPIADIPEELKLMVERPIGAQSPILIPAGQIVIHTEEISFGDWGDASDSPLEKLDSDALLRVASRLTSGNSGKHGRVVWYVLLSASGSTTSDDGSRNVIEYERAYYDPWQLSVDIDVADAVHRLSARDGENKN